MRKLLKTARVFELKLLATGENVGPKTHVTEDQIEAEEQERKQSQQAYEQNKPFVNDAVVWFVRNKTKNPRAYASVMIRGDAKYMPMYLVTTTLTDPAEKSTLISDLQQKFTNFRFEHV